MCEICSWPLTSLKKSLVSDLRCMWSLEQGPVPCHKGQVFVSLRIQVVALCKGVEAMSKWKRKKYLENQVDTGEEEFSPFGFWHCWNNLQLEYQNLAL